MHGGGKETITVRYVEDGITELVQFELIVQAKGTSSAGSDSNDPSDSNPNAPSETNSNKPQTGDSFPMVTGIGVGIIALGCLGTLITLRKGGGVR